MTGSETRWPSAVLFDMDGTLVDSELTWERAEQAYAARFDVSWSAADARAVFGRPLTETVATLRAHGVPVPPEQATRELIELVAEMHSAGVEWLPGARPLLTALAEAGVRCALVSSSYRSLMDPVLAAAEEFVPGLFATSVAGDEVVDCKPHPEPYLTAADHLGVRPEECVVVEDSLGGAHSALAAKIPLLFVPSATADLPEAEALGASIAPSLELVGPTELARVAAGEKLLLR
ncbi:HAD family hydrolase [Enemella sp. A6]|uniref:HAD family hydrolase n=1 Tax=Enemella sp. A6 TaxID=3440152 RepID=UPI003EBBC7E8